MLSEEQRLRQLRRHEDKARKNGFKVIAGIDEAGRGPLAGPVVAAACVLPSKYLLPGINDSKKLTPKQRESLFESLVPAVQWGVGLVDHLEIDEINIYQATIKAMLMAVEKLPCKPDLLLVDGMKLPVDSICCEKIIKGDEKVLAIAAASIIAKVTRDRLMLEYHEQWPEYGFNRHKGYGTAAHLEAIEKHGPCPIHRLSFQPLQGLGCRS